jgi:monoamine oxidase
VNRRVYDLAIVGGGIAGLAAAQQAIGHELDVVVLEATERIGGRIKTIMRQDGLYWDAGAHWLRHPPINPLIREADRLHVRYLNQWRAQDRYWLDGAWLTESENDTIWNDIDEADVLARDLPSIGQDAALGELLNPNAAFGPMTETLLVNQHGDELDRVSAIDRSRAAIFEGDWPVRDGFGLFIDRLFGDLDVRLNAPVSVIDWGSDPLRVDLGTDLIEARRVLVTVSTGALQSGRIHFAPDLPESTSAAIASLPMASQNRVAFGLNPKLLDLEPDSMHYTRINDQSVVFHPMPASQPLMIGIVSGELSRTLERESEDALANMVIAQFESVFGSEAAGTITTPQATTWGVDPYFGGAWANPLPGALTARADLKEPVDDHLYFAGEATSQNAAGTAHGAYQSGVDAADRVALSLGCNVEQPFGVDNRPT